MGDVCAIVLAAGAGTRLKSKKPKVAHEILGKPLVNWVIDSAKAAGIDKIVAVVGHASDQVVPLIEGECEIAHQEQQLGTAHAVQCAMDSDAMKGFEGSVVVLSGDCPLISSDTISNLADVRKREGAGAVVLTMTLDDPFGYGRIIREGALVEGPAESAIVERIVEQKDASAEEAAVCECNSGFYCFDAKGLADALEQIDSNNAQGEFYLTDVMEVMRGEGLLTLALEAADADECLGVNSRVQLAEATKVKQLQVNEVLMNGGVTMIDPGSVWVSPNVRIEPDVTIHPNVTLMGDTVIGEDSEILPNTCITDSKVRKGSIVGPNTRLTDTVVGDKCTIDETISYEAVIDDGASSGPRAYLRPGAHLCEGAKAGTHVEIKKSTVGKGSKVPHLSYIGDTTIGENVNLGAGSITCNYDGANKHATTIGDDTFVGSDTMMVAPVNIGKNVVVGAGSVITRDIPDNALAVARSREKIYDDWSLTNKKQKK